MSNSFSTYLQLCTEYYDLVPHKDEAAALVFYYEAAAQVGGLILEPMCGTGRFLLPLLRAGFNVEGFDASPYMLNALRQKYAVFGKGDAPVSEQYVQNFRTDTQYQLIFIPYGSFGLITDFSEVKQSLQALYNCLKSGGTFFVEIETVASAPTVSGVYHRGIRARADGSSIALYTLPSYDSLTQRYRALCRYEDIKDGIVEAVEVEDFQMHLYRFDEMDQLLKEAGFVDIKKYQNYTRAACENENVPLIIYECSK